MDMVPKLYCKRAHPNEISVPSEDDLDWNVSLAGTAMMLNNIVRNLAEFRKRAEKEGELKKRLNVILTDDDLINKTIDDARKELSIFPDPRNGKYWEGTIGNSTFLYPKYQWDFELWKQGFRRWFGDE